MQPFPEVRRVTESSISKFGYPGLEHEIVKSPSVIYSVESNIRVLLRVTLGRGLFAKTIFESGPMCRVKVAVIV